MIRATPEYQTLAKQTGENTATRSDGGSVDSIGGAVAPVVSLEKGDLEFWTQVAILVVLVLIYRELRRGGVR